MTTEEINVENILDEDANEHPVTHQEVIETVIASLEQNDSAMVMRMEEGHLWKFQYGTVEVFVQLTGEKDDDLLTVWSKILDLPAQNEPELMRHLLEMNWSETFETCFGIFNEQIVVLAQRTVAELSPGEISRAITLVATIADDNDEILQEKYGQSQ